MTVWTYANAGSLPTDSFSVGGHANPDGIEDENGQFLSAEDLGNRIFWDQRWTIGMPVVLNGCNLGLGDFPEQLSEFLMGTPVSAPDNYLWFQSDGSKIVADPLYPQDIENSPPDMNNLGGYLDQGNDWWDSYTDFVDYWTWGE